MTLARFRLLLGISGVGTTTVVAGAVLVFDLPGRWLAADPTRSPVGVAVAALAWPLAWTALLLPLDLLGGLVAVRQRSPVTAWWARWLRGVAVQLGVLLLAGTALVAAARAGGLAGTAAAAAGCAVLLAAVLHHLVALGAPLDEAPPPAEGPMADRKAPRVRWVDARDEAFVGGFGGLVRPTLLAPAAWRTLPPAQRAALMTRRHLAAGAPRVRGTVAAVAWVTLGAAVSAALAGLPLDAASLVRFSAGTTLWAFAGVLLLPTPSRRAVLALDAAAARAVGPAPTRDAITALDQWQDDEPTRAPLVEAVFHPVPARAVRHAVLTQRRADEVPAGAWRVARLALPLGLAGWALLGRAVHCNVGRPALWWMLPGD